MNEPVLESTLRKMRLRQVLPYLKRYPEADFLDIGCGWDATLLKFVEEYISTGVGVDFKAPELKTGKISTLAVTLSDKLPFKDQSFDFITMLAVMEHLENDRAILEECARLLRPGGGILITVPSWYAKPVLEFLAFRLHLVNPEEIKDHKRYYNRSELHRLIDSVDELEISEHSYFQWRFNNLLFCVRPLS
jgi:2-polyprenyl-3-methyl-5-hydroxy-6-metoxy-1,4-benzoquinol methylase